MEKIKEFLKAQWKFISITLILICFIFYLGWDLGKTNAENQDLRIAEKKGKEEIKKIQKENKDITLQYKKETIQSSFYKKQADFYQLAYERQKQETKQLEYEMEVAINSIDTIPADKQIELFSRLSEEYSK